MIEKRMFTNDSLIKWLCFRGVVVLTFASLFVGCGSSGSSTVSGTISYKGNPIEKGTVSFYQASSGRTAQSEIGEGGTYALQMSAEGLPPGEYTVSIGPVVSYEKVQGLNGLEPKMVMEGQESIPPQYRDASRTPLRAEVTGGDDTFDFEMK